MVMCTRILGLHPHDETAASLLMFLFFTCSHFSVFSQLPYNNFSSLFPPSSVILQIITQTLLYDFNRDCTDSLKVSLASALRHSRKQAQATYDRRTANQKKRMAVDLARDYAESRLDEGEAATAGEPEKGDSEVNRGDFVAVVAEESTYLSPRVFIGQVQSIREKEATLLYYKHIGTHLYKLELSVEEWKEGIDCLVPVQLQASKKRAGVYKLMTSTRTIHKIVKG